MAITPLDPHQVVLHLDSLLIVRLSTTLNLALTRKEFEHVCEKGLNDSFMIWLSTCRCQAGIVTLLAPASLEFWPFSPDPLSSLGHRMPAASPSTLSISGAGAASSSSSDRCRLTRGSTIRSTFHGGQLRDRGPPVYSAPPTSPTLSHHEASPLPHARTRATSNLFTKLTSKLTRR